jgi:hypothetical protein
VVLKLGEHGAYLLDAEEKGVRDTAGSSYGNYTVIFTELGLDSGNSTISADTDLNSRVNPVGQ